MDLSGDGTASRDRTLRHMVDPRPPSTGSRARAPEAHLAYWRANLRLIGLLLVIWFTVSFGFGVLLVERLNEIRIPGTGFKLGFWFAQQGSIYVFVLLIVVYVRQMNRLDRKFGVAED
ncbi:MAG: putative solute:sodium symporter small subunit [Planctomycetota bacterium]|jgi:putative solute:sodium symporter small subunit